MASHLLLHMTCTYTHAEVKEHTELVLARVKGLCNMCRLKEKSVCNCNVTSLYVHVTYQNASANVLLLYLANLIALAQMLTVETDAIFSIGLHFDRYIILYSYMLYSPWSLQALA